MLSGVYPDGDSAGTADVSDQELGFKNYLDSLPERVESVPKGERDAFFCVTALIDIYPPLREALTCHGISIEEFAHQGVDTLRGFVEGLPSQRVMMQLGRQWAKNRDLKAKQNELYDWGQLAPMVPYCDVLVTESLFADLVRRDGYQERAIVTADLRLLPEILIEMTGSDLMKCTFPSTPPPAAR